MSTTRKPKTAKPKAAANPTPKKGKAPAKPVVEVDLSASVLAAEPAPATAPAAPAKPLSGLDAAALVLREASEPMDAQALIARILERGLWKTEGKTPAATIYAAMIREIKAKGSSSRFQKVDRGRFAAVS
jgi:hypothetical protein